MKFQKREFVVEYKSRRKAQITAKSIWADIDLKAASKAVEADTGLLFRPKELGNSPGDMAQSPNTAPQAVLSLPADVAPNHNSDRQTSVDMSAPIKAVAEQFVVEVADPIRPPARKAPTTEKRPSKVRRVEPPALIAGKVSLEELEGLEAENAHLKLALKAKLAGENELLRKALERFAR
ncbi:MULTISPECIES: hypothetical protein [Rhizobium]|uniref:hypothetical protein n=1 Tax=Rhizobium TaxID=379 RepID=UPI0013BC8CE9|nr:MULTISPECIES: hypothetical protein [Rhizobium]MBY3321334.1 hypothetical protein [Rhizobium laguerreae]MBY3362928.1 hypothetical protein [Rhizobium laguerreae]MCA2435853.1 hypothetical protein [Rhizobium leguminosarum]NEH73396.1 hypothetical protein [Rhizobium leguminosarum]NKM66530.1 hypothetical protein [Rhizobium laguerreae]